jgi:hypothetical protein
MSLNPVSNTPLRGEDPEASGSDIFKSFKDSQGRFRTQSLFSEYPNPKYPAHFTLKKGGRVGVVNMYEKYMDIGDPTEYEVAIQLLGSWDHWSALCRTKWFMAHLTGWRKELKVCLESRRYHEMVSALFDPKSQIQATKWLADRYGGDAKVVSKRGRPSKTEKEAYLKQAKQESDDSHDDAKRLGLIK